VTGEDVLDVRRPLERLLDRLHRPRTSTRYLPEVDGLRAIAIAMVVIFHVFVALHLARGVSVVVDGPFGAATIPPSPGLFDRLTSFGAGGVEIFFAISGFILAVPFLEARFAGTGRRPSVAGFYRRRVTRLEPPYLVALALWGVVAAVVGGVASGGGALPHVLAGATYTHQLFFGSENPILGVGWSLEVEIVFYLSVPFLAAAFGRVSTGGMRRLCIVLLAPIIIAAAIALRAPLLSAPLYAAFFLSGWLVADLYVTQPGWRENPSRVWDAVAIAAFAACLGVFVFVPFQYLILVGPVATGLLVAGVVRGSFVRSALSSRLPRTVGGMSYSIYLVHYPLLLLWAAWASSHASWATVAGASAAGLVALAVSVAFFLVIERPCMDPTWPWKLISAFGRRPTTAPVKPLVVVPATSEASP
jgi:peptidoglycan/LPS O-acetylase OafA/YrhL